MAQHKTQCPHCFTSYVISDEQFRQSQGVVRCGTCLERFQAELDTQFEVPKFDPRTAFIEPISQEPTQSVSELIDEPTPVRFLDIKNLNNTREFSLQSELSVGIIDADLKAETDRLKTEDILSNIKAREERRSESSTTEEADTTEQGGGEPIVGSVTEPIETSFSDATISSTSEDSLIDQVDALVEEKLLAPTTKLLGNDEPNDLQAGGPKPSRESRLEETKTSNAQAKEPFSLDGPKKSRGVKPWLFLPLMTAACVALALGLIYQLWLQQGVLLNPGSKAERLVTSVASELADRMSQSNVALPVRRDLSQMELVSARTQAHPTRPSTILMQVGLINHADISQAMPWLELSLFNSQGGLLSRRNLSPQDYAYNNDVELMMSSREYRRLSIELLAFPKDANGYELKLLSR